MLPTIATGGRNPVFAVAQWIGQHFVEADGSKTEPTRADIEANFTTNGGVLRGSAVDFAAAATALLDDLKIQARVVLCVDSAGTEHAVCETGRQVLDCRYPGRVLTWEELGYTRNVAAAPTSSSSKK